MGRTYVTHENLYFPYCSVRGVLYDVINVLGPFSVILQPLNFSNVENAYTSSARETARKSQKYFDLHGKISVFN